MDRGSEQDHDSIVLSGSLFIVDLLVLAATLCCLPRHKQPAEHTQLETEEPKTPESASEAGAAGAMGATVDTAPLTGAKPTAAEGALPRWVHPTSVSGGRDRIAAVAATGLHWPPVTPSDGTAPCPDCEPAAAWQWLQRSWGLFIICWAGCLAILAMFGRVRSAGEAAEEGSFVSSLDELLWTSSCRAGLTCFGWAVLGIVGVLLVLVGVKGARHPWSVPLLMVFSPLEDVNLGIVFGGSSFAFEAAVIFFAVLVGIVTWTTYHLSRARQTQQHLGCSWASVTVVGCVISVLCGAAAVGLDVAADEEIRYGVHGEACPLPPRCSLLHSCGVAHVSPSICAGAACGGSVGLTLLVVFQTRELAALCGAEEFVLPGLFLFLPPQALTWWDSRRVAR
jgi:hypothetical protein